MYANNSELAALFGDYAETKTKIVELTARVASLERSAKSRERNRKNKADTTLAAARAELTKAQRTLEELTGHIVAVGYEISRKYMRKFFIKSRRDGDSSTVVVNEAEREDMIQVGVMRLITVADRFDPKKGKPFAWITQVVKNEWYQVIRKIQQTEVNYIRYAEEWLATRSVGYVDAELEKIA
jgi:hypothetical protein